MIATTCVIAIPGTFCAPSIFSAAATALAPSAVTVDAWSWMTEIGPWTIDHLAGLACEKARLARCHYARVVVAGHSTGGAIALAAAAAQPALFDALALSNTGTSMVGHGDVDAILDALQHDEEHTSLLERVIDRSFGSPLPERDRAHLLQYARAVPAGVAAQVLRSQRAVDLADRAASLRIPVAIIHGERDHVRPVNAARALQLQFADASLVLLDAGHTPMMEQPHDYAVATRELIRRIA